MTKLHAIIPAGGAGTRLWPVSRRERPKFLMDLTGSGRSLLQATVMRLAPISDSITVVTGTRHLEPVRGQLGQLTEAGLLSHLPVAVVAEPSARDSMAAIGLATYLLAKKYGPDALVGSFAADHLIQDEGTFRRAVNDAVGAARSGYISTIGLQPTWPSTAYGYIQPSDRHATDATFVVERFVEKPRSAEAERYVAEGFLWNAGMFVMQARVLKGHLAELHPAMDAALSRIADCWNRDSERDVVHREWSGIERIAIDHAIAEPVAASGGVATAVMTNSGWSDVGDWSDLGEFLGSEGSGAQQVLIDSDGSVVRAPADKAVVVLGVPGAVVIDTEDALLVTTRATSQRVKEAVEHLESGGMARFL